MRHIVFLWVFILLLINFRIDILGLNAEMIFPAESWEECSPEQEGYNGDKLNSAMMYWESQCVDPSVGTREALVIKNGCIIWKHKNDNSDYRHSIWSVTKIFTSSAMGVLYDEGKVNLDDKAMKYVSSLSNDYPTVTIRHFLTSTSGYDAQGWENWGWSEKYPGFGDGSLTPWIPDKKIFAPGTAYSYWDDSVNMLGYITTQIAKKSMTGIFNEKIASKIEMRSDKWTWRNYGTVNGYILNGGAGGNEGVFISARELAKLGHLYLNQGIWKDKNNDEIRILSQDWISMATSNQVSKNIEIGKTVRENIDGRGIYGYLWWKNDVKVGQKTRVLPNAPAGTYYRTGHPHNVIFIVPEWNMVIVRLGLDDRPANRDDIWNEVFKKIAAAKNQHILQRPINLRIL